jgi:hypothetical protein
MLRLIGASALLVGTVLTPLAAHGQYAEVPVQLPAVTDGRVLAATQIGRRLFIGGAFTRVSPPTGGAVVVNAGGAHLPGLFPRFEGPVTQILADGFGGWFVVGAFTHVNGEPFAHFARVAPDRTLDRRYRIAADGVVRRVAFAHGRIYLVGDFATINGVTRRRFAVLDGETGRLAAWDPGFGSDTWIGGLSFSSIGVYLTGSSGSQPRLWGFDTGSGRLLFRRTVAALAIAASSARVYLGSAGAQRPLWAVDPLTGEDLQWGPGFGFQYIRGPYEWDATTINGLYLDGQRLFLTGRFLTTDGRTFVTAVDAASGAPTGWRPQPDAPWPTSGSHVTRIGSAIVVTDGPTAFDATTAAAIPFTPATFGTIRTVALAPEGAVVGGDFNGFGGVARNGLAAIDLDTSAVAPWTSPFPDAAVGYEVSELATDGTWLIARSEGTLGGADARIAKIDTASGAIASERTWPSNQTRMRVSGGEVVVATLPRTSPSTSEIGALTIADWSHRALPTAIAGAVTDLDVSGDTVYVSGRFDTVGGQSRPHMAALHRVTGAVLPWRPNPDTAGGVVRADAGRVWVGGDFRRVGGQRRRGLAELDPVSGMALPWNPDVLGIVGPDGFVGYGTQQLAVGPDGQLYVAVGSSPFLDFDAPRSRPTVGGRDTASLVAFSTATGRRLTWRPARGGLVAALPDCLLTIHGCLPRAVPAPSDLTVSSNSTGVSLSWTLPASSSRLGVRLDVGSREGASDLFSVDLPEDQTSFASPAPPGRFFARVRSLAGAASSMPTPDVSFAVGPPDVPGSPLDSIAIVDGPSVTIEWRPPSTGAPLGYVLEAGTGPGLSNVGGLAVAGSASSLSVDAHPGLYWARVVAVNSQGRSAPGGELLIDSRLRQTCGASPVAPEGLSAAVTGRLVTLTWQQPSGVPQVDAHRIVAGSAPGQQNLASIDVTFGASSFQVMAPPGVYYVRIAADSGCFAQAFSNEVVVTVP